MAKVIFLFLLKDWMINISSKRHILGLVEKKVMTPSKQVCLSPPYYKHLEVLLRPWLFLRFHGYNGTLSQIYYQCLKIYQPSLFPDCSTTLLYPQCNLYIRCLARNSPIWNFFPIGPPATCSTSVSKNTHTKDQPTIKKSCIRETKNLSTDADSRTDTILERLHGLIRVKEEIWRVFQGLAGLLRGISWGRSPREIPRKTPSIPTLLLGFTFYLK